MRNLPVLAIKGEMLFMNFFEQKLVKGMYLKIINLIHVTLAIQRLTTCCSEFLSPSYMYLPPTSLLYVATNSPRTSRLTQPVQ
jgi:hypothetical protein